MKVTVIGLTGKLADRRFVLGSAPLTFGRGEGNDIVLPDRAASRLHAELHRDGDDLVLADRGSSNGTWVNGAAVTIRRLAASDEIRISKHRFSLEFDPAEALDTTDPVDRWVSAKTVDRSSVLRVAVSGGGLPGLASPGGRDAGVSAWAWSDGVHRMPPFAGYLLYPANLDSPRNARLLAVGQLGRLQPAGRNRPSGRAGTVPRTAVPGGAVPLGWGGGETAPPSGPRGASRKVFIVHGRDGALVARFRDLLRAVGLEPLEWEPLVRATQRTAPFLGQVVAGAPGLAQATLVLLSPDDIVELHPGLFLGNDRPAERARSMQARPNVYYELGLAMMSCPERTVVVEVGDMRLAGDLAGLNVIRFTGSLPAVNKVLDRLAQAGCPVDRSGTDWMDPGRFDGLDAYQRRPDSP